jgi:hypothetical protein
MCRESEASRLRLNLHLQRAGRMDDRTGQDKGTPSLHFAPMPLITDYRHITGKVDLHGALGGGLREAKK